MCRAAHCDSEVGLRSEGPEKGPRPDAFAGSREFRSWLVAYRTGRRSTANRNVPRGTLRLAVGFWSDGRGAAGAGGAGVALLWTCSGPALIAVSGAAAGATQ